MDLGGRETLIALGALLIVAILLDGFRRVRNSRHGKPRVRKRRQPIFEDNGLDELSRDPPTFRKALTAAPNESESTLSITELSATELSEPQFEAHSKNRASKSDAPFLSAVPTDLEPQHLTPEHLTPQHLAPQPLAPQHAEKTSVEENPPIDDPENIIALHVMAPAGTEFQGKELLSALLANGLRYGPLKIFHSHEEGTGDILFSMANSVNPGTFDLQNINKLSTPGVTFMMTLQDNVDPLASFNQMLASIHGIISQIGGELKDENRCPLSRQTAEHYRQRAIDFNHQRLSANMREPAVRP